MSTETILESVEPIDRSAVTKAGANEDPSTVSHVAKGWRRVAYLALAGLFFVFGVAGAILPGLPATPFLLLTSYFLIRSSPRLNRKLLQSQVFGPILVDWQVHGGVRMHVKLKAVVVVVLTVAFTVYMSGYSAVLSAAVSALAAVGIAVIFRLPVARDERSLHSRAARDRVESP